MRIAALALALAVLACASPRRPPPPSPALARPPFGAIVAGVIQALVAREPEGAVARFYAARGYRPAWVEEPGRAGRAGLVLDLIERAAEDGLDPGWYATTPVRAMLARAGPSAESLAVADVRVSALVLAFAHDLALGRVDPAAIDSLWRSGNSFDPAAAVAATVDTDAVSALADRLRPPHLEYAALRAALRRHRADSVARRIVVNLERWRWLPRDLGARHVMVNFAAFEATAVQDGVVSLHTRVVAGRPDWPTPIASGPLVAVVANPRWNVPPEIAVREILPAMRVDSGLLDREGIAVYRGTRRIDPRTVAWAAVRDTAFPYRLVQAPGPRNPLGLVKLVFTNPFNVALHDTPSRSLFAQAERAASHGCVRVERAVDLAMWAVGSTGRDSLRAALAAAEERGLAANDPVMVHLVYWTAWVEAGALRLGDDVYGWDERLARALAPTP